ncbi:hypothetical protein [Nostoc sp. WHI]|uniref:hypothetical protein n=1 Tax=Nostoc sp. WHI TaxID=2650611 RepID=UPI003FA60B95
MFPLIRLHIVSGDTSSTQPLRGYVPFPLIRLHIVSGDSTDDVSYSFYLGVSINSPPHS